jgi:RNA polymerase sigma-70 factor (ECF subfamily)
VYLKDKTRLHKQAVARVDACVVGVILRDPEGPRPHSPDGAAGNASRFVLPAGLGYRQSVLALKYARGLASAGKRLTMKLSQAEFEKLAMEQIDMLYRIARRLTRGDAGRAEDLVQETYLRALRSRDKFDLQAFGIRPWLLRIMHNLNVSRHEREQRQPTAMEDDQLDAAMTSAAHAPVDSLPLDPASFEGMDQQLVKAIGQLPPEYQTVLILWAVDELAYKEIAEALGVPIGTVMSRLHRARQRLSEQLRDYAVKEGIIRE